MTGDTGTSMPTPLLDLAGLVAGVRWRRRVWVGLALLGLLLGALVSVLLPPKPTALASLLVVHQDEEHANLSDLMSTDVAICQTTEVAAAALSQLGVDEHVEDFLATYRCASAAPHIVTITATAASDHEATRRAQALADAFIANHRRRAQSAGDVQANVALDRRARLERTLATLNSTISSASAPGQLDTLYTARAGITSQILDLARQAEDARAVIPTVTAGTRLLDPGRSVKISRTRSAATDTGVGLVLGLGVGLAMAAVITVVQDRPVLRRDIAAELGVSVIAQLPRPPWGPRTWWRRSRHVRDSQRVAATLARLLRDAREEISLLEIGCPGIAAALALDIAAQLAPEHQMVIVNGLGRESLLRAAARSGTPARIVDIADPAPGQPAPDDGPVLTLGLGTVGPGTSWGELRRLGAGTVLIVRAGHATILELHTIARQLAHSKISAIGVVLIHPDPKDRTDGTLWDALHAALRERSTTGAQTPHGLVTNGTARVPSRPLAWSGNGQPVLEPSSTPDEE